MLWFNRPPERDAATLLNWLNPVWWVSDVQRDMTYGWLSWFGRNPCSNFLSVMVGVAHLPRQFVARDRATIWAEDGRPRWAWTLPCWDRKHVWQSLRNLFVPRPLFSFLTNTREVSWGWKPDGSLGFPWRHLHAQEAAPRVSDAEAALVLSQLRIAELEAEVRALHAERSPSMHREDEHLPQEIGPTTDRIQSHA